MSANVTASTGAGPSKGASTGTPEGRGLVLPRPNLGPEPALDQPSLSDIAMIAAILAAFGVLLLATLVIVLRRTRRRHARIPAATPSEFDDTPRGHFVALSRSIRDALTAHFGTAWRAKTTEELSADSQLEEVLGKEPLGELIRFLDQVDRLKFAAEPSQEHLDSLDAALAAWKPRVASLVETIRASANGRLRGKTADPADAASRPVSSNHAAIYRSRRRQPD